MSAFCLLQHVLPCQNPINYAMLANRFMICICLESRNLNSHNRCCGVSNICICTPQNQHSNWYIEFCWTSSFLSLMTNLQGAFAVGFNQLYQAPCNFKTPQVGIPHAVRPFWSATSTSAPERPVDVGEVYIYPIGSMGLVYLPTFSWCLWFSCK